MGNVCECRGKTKEPEGDDHPEDPDANRKQGAKNGFTKVVQVTEDDLNSEAEEDDDVDELPAPNSNYTAKSRQSVSAEAYGEWNKKTDFKAPVYPKSDEVKQRINAVLEHSFLFSCLDVEEVDVVLLAFQEVNEPAGTTIITQGDDGDKLYLIESGEAQVFKKTADEPEAKLVSCMKPGDAFGELALMYNAPRAATVKAGSDVKLWALDRQTFNHIVKDAAAKKRQGYEESLKEVSLLRDIDPYERSKIADALKTEKYQDSDVIIKEGDEGDIFYLVLEGAAEALKEGKVVMKYKKGGHFGELSLLKNQPRAATVIARGICKVAFMDRKSFKRLIGPLELLLVRDQVHYRKVMKELGLDTKYLD